MVRLAIDPPPSSRHERPRSRPVGRGAVALAIVLAIAVGFWAGRLTAPGAKLDWSRRDAAAQAATAPTVAAPATAPTPTSTPTSTATPTATPTSTAEPIGTASPLPGDASMRRLTTTLSGALEESIAAALRREERGLAEELTAVVNRLLVWDFHVARDARKGDHLEVLWTPPRAGAPGMPPSREPIVEAVRYTSAKLGSVLAVYRFQPEGDRWPRYYRADGTEVESRLVDAPIDDYEQVTSLLRDGRRHKGVDFKTPVGSPVKAPFDGVIARRNWNFAANGNCLEVRDAASGRSAIFLHLDVVPREMAVGRGVKKGQVIAASGNSGRSFAPHLHYQLEDASGKVLDPFDVHRTERRAIGPAQKAAFEAAKAKLDAALRT